MRGKEAVVSVIGERRYDYNDPPNTGQTGCLLSIIIMVFFRHNFEIRILKLWRASLCPAPIDRDIFYDEVGCKV